MLAQLRQRNESLLLVGTKKNTSMPVPPELEPHVRVLSSLAYAVRMLHCAVLCCATLCGQRLGLGCLVASCQPASHAVLCHAGRRCSQPLSQLCCWTSLPQQYYATPSNMNASVSLPLRPPRSIMPPSPAAAPS